MHLGRVKTLAEKPFTSATALSSLLHWPQSHKLLQACVPERREAKHSSWRFNERWIPSFPRTDWRGRCGTCSTSQDGFYFSWKVNIKTVSNNGKCNYAASFRPNFKAALHIYFTETAIPEMYFVDFNQKIKKVSIKMLNVIKQWYFTQYLCLEWID